MKIKFTGEANSEFICIDSIAFQLPNGESAIIGRNITEYVVVDGKFEMIWKGCFEEKGKKHEYRISPVLLNNASIIDISIRDDAPPGYKLIVSSFSAYS